jgi:hypothetical protein
MNVWYTPSDLTPTPEGVAGTIDTVALCLQPIPDRTAMLCKRCTNDVTISNTNHTIKISIAEHARGTWVVAAAAANPSQGRQPATD